MPDCKVDRDSDNEQPGQDQEIHSAVQDVQTRVVELLEGRLHQGATYRGEEGQH